MWPANAFEDAAAHQGLQHRLEMPRRQPMSGRQRLGRHRLVTRIDRDIDDRGDRQSAFARQKQHGPDPQLEHTARGALLLSRRAPFPSRADENQNTKFRMWFHQKLRPTALVASWYRTSRDLFWYGAMIQEPDPRGPAEGQERGQATGPTKIAAEPRSRPRCARRTVQACA